MYLSKIRMRHSSQSVNELVRLGSNGSYASHQLLWKLFTSDKERSFLFREEVGQYGLPQFLVLSENLPLENEPLFEVQTKAFKPVLKKGDRLAFRLRVNPTVSIKNSAGKSKKHDVLMHAKRQARQNGVQASEQISRAMDDAANAWVSDEKRLNRWGVSLDSVPEIERYTQHVSSKGKASDIRFSSVDFQGLLTVVEPEVFLGQLIKGFGRAKALGCGLMLIRRI